METPFGKVTLIRHAGRRRTVLVDSQSIPSMGHGGDFVGFTVTMPDRTELDIRLDHEAVEALFRGLHGDPA